MIRLWLEVGGSWTLREFAHRMTAAEVVDIMAHYGLSEQERRKDRAAEPGSGWSKIGR